MAQTCCPAARIVFSANLARPRLLAGGSSARTIGLLLAAAASAILSLNGLVICLYQRVVGCKPYHFEVNIAMLVQPRRKCRLLDPLAGVTEEWLFWFLV